MWGGVSLLLLTLLGLWIVFSLDVGDLVYLFIYLIHAFFILIIFFRLELYFSCVLTL